MDTVYVYQSNPQFGCIIQKIALKVRIFADTLGREQHENRANCKDLKVGVDLSSSHRGGSEGASS